MATIFAATLTDTGSKATQMYRENVRLQIVDRWGKIEWPKVVTLEIIIPYSLKTNHNWLHNYWSTQKHRSYWLWDKRFNYHTWDQVQGGTIKLSLYKKHDSISV